LAALADYDTPLDTIVRNLGRDTAIFTGTLTNNCQQAYERGYRVVFGADVTATDDSGRSPNWLYCARDSRSCWRLRRSWIGCPARVERTQSIWTSRETISLNVGINSAIARHAARQRLLSVPPTGRGVLVRHRPPAAAG